MATCPYFYVRTTIIEGANLTFKRENLTFIERWYYYFQSKRLQYSPKET